MRVLHSWLRELIPFDLTPEVLADRLSMLGLELEGLERFGERYRGFVVGRVERKERHPNADRLSVCTVDTGSGRVQVVCGAPNVAEGQRVALGTAGAIVPRNQHDPAGAPFTLGTVEVRGVRSEGMICSAYELDLGDDRAGILVLPPGAVVGRPLAEHLGLDDVAYDLEITANRPDWLSHIGVAREIGVLVGRHPRLPAVRLRESTEPVGRHLAVTVENAADCPRFAARVIRGIRMTASPPWMQERLLRAGLRPRNAVVDVTNYVMLECGQPLHAFDHALLRGGRIVVRRAGRALPFRTLDGREHNLPADAVMVCDGEREVSIAGIMGGANSEISDDTTDIVLESACWNPSAIRRTRRALGISTDASQRFERGADPNATDFAIHRAAALILQCVGGELLAGTLDVYPHPVAPREIPLRPARANAILGTALPRREVIGALKRLGLKPGPTAGGSTMFSIPTYRVDLEREIDLIEEVARVVGYDNIPVATHGRVELTGSYPAKTDTAGLRSLAVSLGYREAVTLSLQTEAEALLGGGTPVLVRNPQNQEMAAMRTSLVPGLLDVVALNLNRGNADLRLFEVGHVFERTEPLEGQIIPGYRERRMIAFAATGKARPAHWSEPPAAFTLFDLKGDVSDLLEACQLDKRRLIPYSTPGALADPALAVETDGGRVGYLGVVRTDLLKSLGIGQEVLIAEVECEALLGHAQRRYRPVPRFPRVRRDLAFMLDAVRPAGEVEDVIRSAAGDLLRHVELFDVFEGKSLPPGKRSLAFALELMSYERTLTEGEVEGELRRIVEAVERKCGGVLRTL